MSAKFDRLVEQAVEVERELRGLEAGDQRISGEGLLAASLEVANATIEDVDRLLERIEADLAAYPSCRQYLAHATRLLGDGTIRLTTPLPLQRQNFLGIESARGELPGGTEPRLLWCAAVKVATQHRPEAFGEVDDWPSHEAGIAKLRSRRAELFSQIETAWTTSDVLITEPTSPSERDKGLRYVMMRCAPSVAVGPLLGERLINHLLVAEREPAAA